MRFVHAFPPPRLWAAALLAACLAALPVAAGAEPPLWRVRAPGVEIVLFGSVHLLTPGLDWRSPALVSELAKAETVWSEIPLDPSTREEAGRVAQTLARLPAGKTLTPLLSRNGRARLARVATSLGIPAQALNPYRPWFAEVTLTLLQLQRRGAAQDAGVEESIAREAPATAHRRAFETPEEQIRILASASEREQAASLEETLREIEEEPGSFDDLQKAWLSGDVAWIEREGIEPLRRASPGLFQRLVTARNRRWADQIELLLKAKERAFIVVGVGHLVGPGSVPALLRRRGFTVEGP